MKNVGVWMDKEKALIIETDASGERMNVLESEIEAFNPTGGSRSKTKWGPQDVVQDSKYTEREKHQMKRYFDNLAEALKEAEQLVIFGPADTNAKFNSYLKDHKKDLADKVKGVEKADSMTDNQVKALVRDFYNA
ncbi:hypothetical protein [Robertkochia sediminum]|uniref:hypothetical protein n=1 Tax=Robertkochia sediminum TaxID=2785326 RepID=UPI001931C1B5|nr:hypothetical protein [Robertkochia sediminum]MBL7473010.1 hypothetical protein [Robertkochia sediminum]